MTKQNSVFAIVNVTNRGLLGEMLTLLIRRVQKVQQVTQTCLFLQQYLFGWDSLDGAGRPEVVALFCPAHCTALLVTIPTARSVGSSDRSS